MKKFILLLCACILFTSCANEKTTVCEGTINNIKTRVELVHTDTEALSQVVINETDYASFNIVEEDLQALLDQTINIYEGIEGLSYTYEMNEGILKETITVDFENGDLDALEKAGLVDFGNQSGKDKYIDYPMTIDVYIQQGLTCK